MKDIKEIAFMIGTQGDGYNDNVITFEGEEVKKAYENFMYSRYENSTLSHSKQEFLEKLSEIDVENWKDSYIVFGTVDGYSWELNVYYEDGEKLIKKGANDYPENMDELLDLLEINIEDFKG